FLAGCMRAAALLGCAACRCSIVAAGVRSQPRLHVWLVLDVLVHVLPPALVLRLAPESPLPLSGLRALLSPVLLCGELLGQLLLRLRELLLRQALLLPQREVVRERALVCPEACLSALAQLAVP